MTEVDPAADRLAIQRTGLVETAAPSQRVGKVAARRKPEPDVTDLRKPGDRDGEPVRRRVGLALSTEQPAVGDRDRPDGVRVARAPSRLGRALDEGAARDWVGGRQHRPGKGGSHPKEQPLLGGLGQRDRLLEQREDVGTTGEDGRDEKAGARGQARLGVVAGVPQRHRITSPAERDRRTAAHRPDPGRLAKQPGRQRLNLG